MRRKREKLGSSWRHVGDDPCSPRFGDVNQSSDEGVFHQTCVVWTICLPHA
jgi:hypothetical protein